VYDGADDWRMPTLEELDRLYASYPNNQLWTALGWLTNVHVSADSSEDPNFASTFSLVSGAHGRTPIGSGEQAVTCTRDPTQPAGPVVSQVSISGPTWANGQARMGGEQTGNYTYSPDNDPEGSSTYQWYRAFDKNGRIDKVAIANAASRSYTPSVESGDENKYLVFEVRPRSVNGASGVRAWAVRKADGLPRATGASIELASTQATGKYTYTDPDGDAEGGTTFQWFRSNDAAGLDRQAISGATGPSYVLGESDEGKYLQIEIRPGSHATGECGPGKACVVGPTATAITATTMSVSPRVTFPAGEYNIEVGNNAEVYEPWVVRITGSTPSLSGNASATSKLKLTWAKPWAYSGPLNVTLITPVGARLEDLAPNCSLGALSSTCEVPLDLSAYPRAGTWTLEFRTPGDPGVGDWKFDLLLTQLVL
jgi:hypothetical protein